MIYDSYQISYDYIGFLLPLLLSFFVCYCSNLLCTILSFYLIDSFTNKILMNIIILLSIG